MIFNRLQLALLSISAAMIPAGLLTLAVHDLPGPVVAEDITEPLQLDIIYHPIEKQLENEIQDIAATAGAGVDINNSGFKDLQRLPRIGPRTARLIIDHRSRFGPFKSVDDLTAIKGIGPKTLQILRPHVIIGSVDPVRE